MIRWTDGRHLAGWLFGEWRRLKRTCLGRFQSPAEIGGATGPEFPKGPSSTGFGAMYSGLGFWKTQPYHQGPGREFLGTIGEQPLSRLTFPHPGRQKAPTREPSAEG